MARMPKSESIRQLERVKGRIRELEGSSTSSQLFFKWQSDTRIAIEYVYGKDSTEASEFTDIRFHPPPIGIRVISQRTRYRDNARDQQRRLESFQNGLTQSEALLESMIENIVRYWPNEDEAYYSDAEENEQDSKKVLIVHGSDSGTKHEVARLIERLDLEAIILEEQASIGRTLIDKFEQVASDIGFTVVLLTPDDEGRKIGTKDQLKPRARQNVILELGFVAASLGRNRVCALLKGDLEIPSDYKGVVYIPMDDMNWKLDLIKEWQ